MRINLQMLYITVVLRARVCHSVMINLCEAVEDIEIFVEHFSKRLRSFSPVLKVVFG